MIQDLRHKRASKKEAPLLEMLFQINSPNLHNYCLDMSNNQALQLKAHKQAKEKRKNCCFCHIFNKIRFKKS